MDPDIGEADTGHTVFTVTDVGHDRLVSPGEVVLEPNALKSPADDHAMSRFPGTTITQTTTALSILQVPLVSTSRSARCGSSTSRSTSRTRTGSTESVTIRSCWQCDHLLTAPAERADCDSREQLEA